MWNRHVWDDIFPTLVRYSGLLLTFILVGFCLAGRYVEAAPGFVAAAGMLLYKSVHDAARKPKDDDFDERWTHLP